jgi:nitrate/TMAO reductase-like tetraheme cytochrome c subunit
MPTKSKRLEHFLQAFRIIMKLLILFLFLMLGSCQFGDNKKDDLPYDVIKIKQNEFSLYFSHNINGETHPCGCHQFPRGGLAQLQGLMHQLKDPKRASLYVDIGDTFFPSSVIPKNRENSLLFTAQTIAQSFDLLGLRYLVPGDQDFALEETILSSLQADRKFRFLISNLSNPNHLRHKSWSLIEHQDFRLYIVALVDPKIIPSRFAHLFYPTTEGMQKVLPEITEYGYQSENPKHQLIVLSHAGMSADRKLAQEFPQINWIVGSHSSSFTQVPNKEGQTTLVQVLSRNHFLGEVRFQLSGSSIESQFVMHEIKDDLDKVLDPNPMSKLVDAYLVRLSEIQKDEQKLALQQRDIPQHPLNTANSCLDCHGDQHSFWEKQRHSLAYLTLVRAGQSFDLSCIQCHSVGANTDRGFHTAEEMIIVDPKRAHESIQKENAEAQRGAYWEEFRKAFANPPTLSSASEQEIFQLRQQWTSLDKKHGVTHQFANVQCLNCHDQHNDHPFHISSEPRPTPEMRRLSIENKCLDCHNHDQSPAWYLQKENGLLGDVNREVFNPIYSKLSCPSLDVEDY